MKPHQKQLAELIGHALGEARKATDLQIAELEVRVHVLEARLNSTKSLADFYKGPHLLNGAYSRGDLVTRSGSVWLALDDTKAVPGHSEAWKLIAKGGS